MSTGLGIYIHAPFCRHACPYCDFYKTELRDHPARARLDFPGQIEAELALLLDSDAVLGGSSLETIYIGGGTPSTLSPKGVATLLEQIGRRFGSTPIETTMEANPENLTPLRAEAWRRAGFNRISVGVQSFQPRELELLERLHGPTTIEAGIRAAQNAGFDNISVDLMFALPGQRMDDWIQNLRRAVDLMPQHISFYGLTWHEGTPFSEQLRRGLLREADEGLQEEMYLAGVSLLMEHGYEHYEISNFARPGFRSRHNERYWSRSDVLGLGPGAHSNVAQRRWRNPDDLEGWRESIAGGKLPRVDVEELDGKETLAEALFTALRRAEGIHAKESRQLHRMTFEWLKRQPSDARCWFAHADEERIALNARGWLVSDSIIESVLLQSPPISLGRMSKK
jgi:oxygen-independent coproporphyrinogen-3 oxidase